jgi:hypothetical protein
MADKNAGAKLAALRASGFKGAVDQNGDAVMTRTDGKGNPLPLFRGGTGTGTPDDSRGRRAGRLARSRRPG